MSIRKTSIGSTNLAAIPRSREAIAVLRGDESAARSGAPRWLAAATMASLVSTVGASVAHADPGSVELRSGGRVRGDVVAVVPNDRVVVMLADGSSMTIAWADVETVVDGDRVYDSDGNVTRREVVAATPAPIPAPAPAPTPAPAPVLLPANRSPYATMGFGPAVDPGVAPGSPAYMVPVTSDREAYAVYVRLPHRGGAVTMTTFGGLFAFQGSLLTGFAARSRRSGDYGTQARALLIPGTISIGLGALMLGLGIRRLRVRSRGIEELRTRGFFVAGLHDSFAISFDADVTAGQFVPRMMLRF